MTYRHWFLNPNCPYLGPMQYEDPFALLEKRRLQREQERLALRKRLAELDADAFEDQTVLKGLTKLYGSKETLGHVVAAAAAASAPKPVSAALVARTEAGKDMMYKDMILAVLRDGEPSGMTAAQIRAKAVLRFGKHINPNTLTVTLVRASKQRGNEAAQVRCEGRTWFYVSKPEAQNISPPTELELVGSRH